MKKKILLYGFKKLEKNNFLKKFPKSYFVFSIKDFKKVTAVICSNRKYFQILYEKNYFDKFEHLEWIHIPGTGVENYTKLKKFLKTKFTNIKTLQVNQVADHAFALLLSLTRKISFLSRYGQKQKFDFKPFELFNKRALVIGFGGIGQSIAKRAHSFGLIIDIISDSYLKKNILIKKSYPYKNLIDGVSNADVIFICCPLLKKTNLLINDKIFKACKDDVIIINISRGKIINTNDLLKNIKNKKILAAGLDVTDPEPLPNNHDLYKLKNVIITPHIGGMSHSLTNKHLELVEINISKYLKDNDLINEFDLIKGY